MEGQENIQEILSKQLYLCQFLCALSILRQGEDSCLGVEGRGMGLPYKNHRGARRKF